MTGSVLFLTSGRRAPSSRFRVLQFVDRLRADGWKVTVAPCIPDKYASHHEYPGGIFADGLLTVAKIASRLVGAMYAVNHDIVYLDRELLPKLCPAPEEFLLQLNRNVIFDFDDAIWLNYPDETVNPIATVVRMCPTVIAGNEILGEWALRHNDNVWVLPTAVDTDRFVPRTRVGDGSLLVWTGSASTLKYLEPLAPALAAVRARHPGVTLRVICDRPPRCDMGLPVEFIPWSEAVEAGAVRAADIGLMPLADDEWCRGKCGAKLLQYMACGLASVAAPWGIVSDILDAGTCGLPAQDFDEWVDSLDRLLSDPELRKLQGDAARERAVSLYSKNVIYPRWKDVLESALEKKLRT